MLIFRHTNTAISVVYWITNIEREVSSLACSYFKEKVIPSEERVMFIKITMESGHLDILRIESPYTAQLHGKKHDSQVIQYQPPCLHLEGPRLIHLLKYC